ncbi:hypothetical protein ASPWEDRAFT_207719 [Aspergillus wentii DTO 134E9]|uniref:Uncharacterized protein n=1 Tax=Aspergillus wentii DTO 134E9 TaxID=1073089 RepID=A0A1L9RZN7_ASPWE|nr:uncharacterized protein ASPWEDRAFT_207719 [Aspergillus wentii DTO 134E9]OJJ40399.1 hypothetical protein ASPWEDRAFT_207719 [Aspergillus wentii DTO 134E9]
MATSAIEFLQQRPTSNSDRIASEQSEIPTTHRTAAELREANSCILCLRHDDPVPSASSSSFHAPRAF